MVQIVQDEAVVTKQQNYDSQQSRGAATVSNQAIIQVASLPIKILHSLYLIKILLVFSTCLNLAGIRPTGSSCTGKPLSATTNVSGYLWPDKVDRLHSSRSTLKKDHFFIGRWKKCTCASPAVFDNQGRGNCNFGATKLDTKGKTKSKFLFKNLYPLNWLPFQFGATLIHEVETRGLFVLMLKLHSPSLDTIGRDMPVSLKKLFFLLFIHEF